MYKLFYCELKNMSQLLNRNNYSHNYSYRQYLNHYSYSYNYEQRLNHYYKNIEFNYDEIEKFIEEAENIRKNEKINTPITIAPKSLVVDEELQKYLISLVVYASTRADLYENSCIIISSEYNKSLSITATLLTRYKIIFRIYRNGSIDITPYIYVEILPGRKILITDPFNGDFLKHIEANQINIKKIIKIIKKGIYYKLL